MMLKNRWKKSSMPDPFDYICCLSWKKWTSGGRLLADAPEHSPGVILMEESWGTILYEKIVMKHTTGEYHKRS